MTMVDSETNNSSVKESMDDAGSFSFDDDVFKEGK